MIYEKLFLDKNKEVFVLEDITTKLKQHQKDGLRSLYIQYFKKKSGYILNDPPNAGKRTLVAVFLRAVKHLLKHPVLIITSNVEKWRDTFCHWTEDISDINFERMSSDTKILVTNLNEVAAVSRKEWSVVVVEDAECAVKLFRQLKALRAAFKVVLISVDLKKNYKTFATIYEWIDPAEKVVLDKFSQQLQNTPNDLEKAVLLDWYFQNKLLRRNGIGSATDTIVEDKPKPVNKIPSNSKPASKRNKNKDVTGTKVKRSKPKPAQEISHETLSDSIDFEFDTMTAPCVSRSFDKNEEDNTTESCRKIDVKGNKRKRASVFESDDDSGTDEKANTSNSNKETLVDCVNITNENEINNISKDYETKDSFIESNEENRSDDDARITISNIKTEKGCVNITNENEVNIVAKDSVKNYSFMELDQENDSDDDARRNSNIKTVKDCMRIPNEKDDEIKNSVKNVSSKNGTSHYVVMPLFAFEIEDMENSDLSETARDIDCESSQNNNDLKETSQMFSVNAIHNVALDSSERLNNEIIANCKNYEFDDIEMNESKELTINNEIQVNEIKETVTSNRETVVRETCSQGNTTILEDTVKAMEDNIMNNFKGSILDCLF